MSKRKNHIVKASVGKPIQEQELLSIFGLLYERNPSACRLAEQWFYLCILGSRSNFPSFTTDVDGALKKCAGVSFGPVGGTLDAFQKELNIMVGLLVGLTSEAALKRSAQFLQEFAAAVHCLAGNEGNKQRAVAALWVQCQESKAVSSNALSEALKKAGLPLGKRQIQHRQKVTEATKKGDSARKQADRMLNEFGVSKLKAKRGRPKTP